MTLGKTRVPNRICNPAALFYSHFDDKWDVPGLQPKGKSEWRIPKWQHGNRHGFNTDFELGSALHNDMPECSVFEGDCSEPRKV